MRRVVVLVTCLVVAGLGGVFAVVQWERANRLATLVSTLAAVASIGVAIWTAQRDRQPSRSVRGTGDATATSGGRATSGLVGTPDSGSIDVADTGSARASGDGEATSGADLRP